MKVEFLKISNLIFLITCLFFLSTSFNNIYFANAFELGANLPYDTSKAIVIEVDTNLVVNNFIKTFYKKFFNRSSFFYEYSLLLAEKLKSTKHFSIVYIHLKANQNSNRFMRLDQYELAKVDSLEVFNNITYVLKINNFKIDNSYSYATMMIGGMSMVENCVINNKIQLVNYNKNQVINEYENNTERPVDITGNNNAFELAMHYSTKNIIKYILKQKPKL